jgi:tetratricopeptide (TPR) repeat protein
MSVPPKIFISAASGDLRGARQAVKDALLDIGCHPVEQTHFPPDYRTVATMLREKIEGCQALIHIAGMRYGAEPDPAALPSGAIRRSYTQMEYDIARKLAAQRGDKRFRVYTFVCSEDCPYDAEPDVESAEKRELQRQHRRAIVDGQALYETPKDTAALKERVRLLREEVLQLLAEQSRRERLTLAGIALLLVTLAGVSFGVFHYLPGVIPGLVKESVEESFSPDVLRGRLRVEIEQRFERDAQAARDAGEKWPVIRELEKRRDLALGRVDGVIETIQKGLADKPNPVFKEAIRILEKEGIDATIEYLESHKPDLQAIVDRAAAQAEAAKDVLYRELRPWMMQAELHEIRAEWDKALALFQLVVDKAPQWFVARNGVGKLLYVLGRYPEAETHLRASTALAKKPEEEATALNNLAYLLWTTNRLAEAEPLLARAVTIYEKSLGENHPSVAAALNNLAQLQMATNRLAEAERLVRRALVIVLKFTHATGHEHPHLWVVFGNYVALLGKMSFTKEQIGQRIAALGAEAQFDEEGYRRLLTKMPAE